MDLKWFKSKYCGQNNSCVEVARTPAGMMVRDTKDEGQGPILTFSAKAWQEFLADLPAS
jgi:hypothetical protein